MTPENRLRFSKLLSAGRKLSDGLNGSADSVIDTHENFGAWVDDFAEFFRDVDPTGTLEANWTALPYSLLVSQGGYDLSNSAANHFVNTAVGHRITFLSRVPRELSQLEAREHNQTVVKAMQREAIQKAQNNDRHIFIVHGRDEGFREAATNFVLRADLQPIVLQDVPSGGRTVVEKLEHYSRVGFAMVLMSADDMGCLKEDFPAKAEPRARQNVILELGYFMAYLGRKHVVAVYKSDMSPPSDIHGVVWISYNDPDGWKMKVAREMAEAGIAGNWSKALGIA